MELGCGTGRVTAHLATVFSKVYGCDISKPHLQIAEENLKKLNNIEFMKILTPDQLLIIDKVNVVFSMIVLQYNAPPLIYKYIENILKVLKPGGIAFFQVPTYKKNYNFSINRYLKNIEKTGSSPI